MGSGRLLEVYLGRCATLILSCHNTHHTQPRVRGAVVGFCINNEPEIFMFSLWILFLWVMCRIMPDFFYVVGRMYLFIFVCVFSSLWKFTKLSLSAFVLIPIFVFLFLHFLCSWFLYQLLLEKKLCVLVTASTFEFFIFFRSVSCYYSHSCHSSICFWLCFILIFKFSVIFISCSGSRFENHCALEVRCQSTRHFVFTVKHLAGIDHSTCPQCWEYLKTREHFCLS